MVFGVAPGVSATELGPEDEALDRAVKKEFAEIEMRRRSAEKHEQAFKQYEQKMEDEQKEKLKKYVLIWLFIDQGLRST